MIYAPGDLVQSLNLRENLVNNDVIYEVTGTEKDNWHTLRIWGIVDPDFVPFASEICLPPMELVPANPMLVMAIAARESRQPL